MEIFWFSKWIKLLLSDIVLGKLDHIKTAFFFKDDEGPKEVRTTI